MNHIAENMVKEIHAFPWLPVIPCLFEEIMDKTTTDPDIGSKI
jgi:hypothetical protein